MDHHYEILGLNTNASLKEINKKYKSLARKLHPDKGGSSHLFKQIQTAYDEIVLSKTGCRELPPNIYELSGATNNSFFAAPFFQGLRNFFHGEPSNFYSETVQSVYHNDQDGEQSITKRTVNNNGEITEYWN
mgnify:CR=1 FL=1